MSLDLDEILLDWECSPGEISARSIASADGSEYIQLRIELGVLQMFPDGRPDGARYRGFPSALDFLAHEQRVGGEEVDDDDARELERELTQFNYRRLALASVADDALRHDDKNEAVRQLLRCVRDIDQCLRRARMIDELRQRPPEQVGLKPTLLFNRARLASQLRVVQGHYDEAIAEADRGAEALEQLFLDCGVEPEQSDEDPGVQYLRQLAARLRKQYAIPRTLQQQLDTAVENEDFESAARIRAEIRRRQQQQASLDEGPEPPDLERGLDFEDDFEQ